MIDLEFFRETLRPCPCNISNDQQFRAWHKPPEVFSVAAPHFSDTKYSHSQFRHRLPRAQRAAVLTAHPFRDCQLPIRSPYDGTFRSSTTPRKYFRLAATLCAGTIVGSPNFTSCSTTIQPEYPFLSSVPKKDGKSISP